MGLATTESEARALPTFTLGDEECGVNILTGADNPRGGLPIVDMRIRSSRTEAAQDFLPTATQRPIAHQE